LFEASAGVGSSAFASDFSASDGSVAVVTGEAAAVSAWRQPIISAKTGNNATKPNVDKHVARLIADSSVVTVIFPGKTLNCNQTSTLGGVHCIEFVEL
jgi:hypothetical protein